VGIRTVEESLIGTSNEPLEPIGEKERSASGSAPGWTGISAEPVHFEGTTNTEEEDEMCRASRIGVFSAPRTMLYVVAFLAIASVTGWAESSGKTDRAAEIDKLSASAEPQVIEWRRHIHENPELSGKEFRTTKMVADLLQKLGMDVKISPTGAGVIGTLKGQRATPVVALRADMDALPVTELTGVPFASKTKGVMHACGHDAHTAILMGAAKVLSSMKDQLPGTVKFIFQPAEEIGLGSRQMIGEGALDAPKPEAIFGLHVDSSPSGTLLYRSAGVTASSDELQIVVTGKGTHGAMPWMGVDPVVVASQIVLGLQTIVSRQTDLTVTPAVVTVGMINGGTRPNIIPEQVEMKGTIRTFDPEVRQALRVKIDKTVKAIADSAGATAEVKIIDGSPPVVNDGKLVAQMGPTLQRVAGNKFQPGIQVTASEDFAFYAEKIPGLFYNLGIRPPNTPPYPNHSPKFLVDDAALIVGVRAMSNLVVDFMEMKKQ
jgi:amidohydrolase